MKLGTRWAGGTGAGCPGIRPTPEGCVQQQAPVSPHGGVQGVPEDAPLAFELELVSFERQQHWTRMDAGAKIARAQALKAQGNQVFKAGGAPELARSKWQKALKMLSNLFDCESEAQARPGSEAGWHARACSQGQRSPCRPRMAETACFASLQQRAHG